MLHWGVEETQKTTATTDLIPMKTVLFLEALGVAVRPGLVDIINERTRVIDCRTRATIEGESTPGVPAPTLPTAFTEPTATAVPAATKRSRFAAEAENIILGLAKAGRNIVQIGIEVRRKFSHITDNAISHFLTRHPNIVVNHAGRKRVTAEALKTWREMVDGGSTAQQAADATGYSIKTVENYLEHIAGKFTQ